MPRIKKIIVASVFLRPIIAPGKHLSDNHISKIKCYLDDPNYTSLDIALAVGVRVKQVNYLMNKLKKENYGKEQLQKAFSGE